MKFRANLILKTTVQFGSSTNYTFS